MESHRTLFSIKIQFIILFIYFIWLEKSIVHPFLVSDHDLFILMLHDERYLYIIGNIPKKF